MIRGPSRSSWELGCGVFLFDAKLQGHFEAHTAIAHSGCRGPEPMGIITWKYELLVVPFSGEWALVGPNRSDSVVLP